MQDYELYKENRDRFIFRVSRVPPKLTVLATNGGYYFR